MKISRATISRTLLVAALAVCLAGCCTSRYMRRVVPKDDKEHPKMVPLEDMFGAVREALEDNGYRIIEYSWKAGKSRLDGKGLVRGVSKDQRRLFAFLSDRKIRKTEVRIESHQGGYNCEVHSSFIISHFLSPDTWPERDEKEEMKILDRIEQNFRKIPVHSSAG